MPKHITADKAPKAPCRVVIVTLDNHLTGAVARVNTQLARQVPGLTLSVHAASNWGANPDALAHCIEEIGKGDIIIATMLFMEDHIQAVMPALTAGALAARTLRCRSRMSPRGARMGMMRTLLRRARSRYRAPDTTCM